MKIGSGYGFESTSPFLARDLSLKKNIYTHLLCELVPITVTYYYLSLVIFAVVSTSGEISVILSLKNLNKLDMKWKFKMQTLKFTLETFYEDFLISFGLWEAYLHILVKNLPTDDSPSFWS